MGKRVCPNCCLSELRRDSSENAENLGYEPGTVDFYHCNKCGAEIEVYAPINKEE